jgi:hypothetical protein
MRWELRRLSVTTVLACEREYQKEYSNMPLADTFVAFILITTLSAFL